MGTNTGFSSEYCHKEPANHRRLLPTGKSSVSDVFHQIRIPWLNLLMKSRGIKTIDSRMSYSTVCPEKPKISV